MDELKRKSNTELKKIAKAAGLKAFSNLGKRKLIDKILYSCTEEEIKKHLGYQVSVSYDSKQDTESIDLAKSVFGNLGSRESCLSLL